MEKRLTRTINDYFPYPIAANFKVLLTDECMDAGPLRLQYLLRTAESIARFLGMVLLLECRRYIETNSEAQPPRALVADFAGKLRKPSFGSWIHIAREGSRWLAAEEAELVVPEMKNVFFNDRKKETIVKKAADKLVEIRNGLSHEKIRAFRAADFETLCSVVNEQLEIQLEALEFLQDVSLGYVTSIEVSKKRNAPPSFTHRIKELSGHSDDFEGTRTTLDDYRESDAVIIKYERHDAYLNMEPLLIFDAESGKASDIFYLAGFSNPRKIVYLGCKHGGDFTSDQCPRSEEIEQEAAQLLSIFSEEAQS
jgi:hypothetical protein